MPAGPSSVRVLMLLAAALLATVARADLGVPEIDGLPPIDANTSLLVVSPHPDRKSVV